MSGKIQFLGIVGTNGAGKRELINWFCGQDTARISNTYDLSMSEFAENLAKETGMEFKNRDDFALYMNEKRQEFGGDYFIKRLCKQAQENINLDYPALLVVESIRCLDEVSFLEKNKSPLVFLDALSEIRFNRIKERGSNKDTDLNFELFLEQEKRENSNIETWKQNIPEVSKHALFTIRNDHKTILEFHDKLDRMYAAVFKRFKEHGTLYLDHPTPAC